MGKITVNNLGKAYKSYPTKLARLKEWVLPFTKARHNLHWVLRDINFEINPGESVGIIGVNGAGKSTLLKMLTGTTRATTGDISITGRVVALLELGMGFHPDFTGRQNVIMAGQLLGHSHDEINTLLPLIESFADIGAYIDEPVRIYSSGMQARLAFSVATAVKPNILIVDEVLSVGDISFQAKCMQRMHDLLGAGVTILFVSHATNQVRQFCTKAIYLSKGRIKMIGPSDKVCDVYQNDLIGSTLNSGERIPINEGKSERIVNKFEVDENLRKNSVIDVPGSMDISFTAFDIFDESGNRLSSCQPGEKVIFKASLRANSKAPSGAAVGLLIADKSGYPLLSCNSNYYDVLLPAMNPGDCLVLSWSMIWPFYSGEFRVDIGIKPEPFANEFYDRVFCAKTILVQTPVKLLKKNFGGLLHADADVEIFQEKV